MEKKNMEQYIRDKRKDKWRTYTFKWFNDWVQERKDASTLCIMLEYDWNDETFNKRMELAKLSKRERELIFHCSSGIFHLLDTHTHWQRAGILDSEQYIYMCMCVKSINPSSISSMSSLAMPKGVQSIWCIYICTH